MHRNGVWQATVKREEKWMQTESSSGTSSFISRCKKSVSGTFLKRKGLVFLMLFWSTKTMVVPVIPWQHWGRERKELSGGCHGTECYKQETWGKFREAKRSLAPNPIACWIRPRDSTSKQPVLLTQGTERKLSMHKVALWYECKKPRSNHIRSYFKKC